MEDRDEITPPPTHNRAELDGAISEDEESPSDYRKGGYHPVNIGDIFDARYLVVDKLGWGHFSTVWLAYDKKRDRLIGLKIQKSAARYTEAAYDEIELLQKVAKYDPKNEKCVVHLLDWFTVKGPNGTHVCMVFEALGESLLSIIRRSGYRGIQIPAVVNILYQLLIACDYLHRTLKMIHTDIKPENVLVVNDPEDMLQKLEAAREMAKQLENARANDNTDSKSSEDAKNLSKSQKKRLKRKRRKEAQRVAESESKSSERSSTPAATRASSSSSSPAPNPTTTTTNNNNIMQEEAISASSPEEKRPYAMTRVSSTVSTYAKGARLSVADLEALKTVRVKLVDFGNACDSDHRITSTIQTRQYRAPEVIVGGHFETSADMWSIATMTFELVTGDFLFEPKADRYGRYTKDDDHLAQFIELLGPFPTNMASQGRYFREFFNKKGDLKHIRNLHPWGLGDVLVEKYHIDAADAKSLAAFLTPMLDYSTTRRASAGQQMQMDFVREPALRYGLPRSLLEGTMTPTTPTGAGGKDFREGPPRGPLSPEQSQIQKTGHQLQQTTVLASTETSAEKEKKEARTQQQEHQQQPSGLAEQSNDLLRQSQSQLQIPPQLETRTELPSSIPPSAAVLVVGGKSV